MIKTFSFLTHVGMSVSLVGCFLLVSCGGGVFERSGAKNERTAERLTVFSQQITSPIRSFEVKAGETYSLPITVKNTGTEDWQGGQGPMTVDAGYRRVNSDGKLPEIEGSRAVLGLPILKPGESDTVDLKVAAPPEPGLYTLRVSMVHEGVAWFNTQGGPPLSLKVKVG